MIVVTGGAGFIGSNVVTNLLKRGKEVVVVDNLGNGPKWKNIAAKPILDYFHSTDFLQLLLTGDFEGEIEAIVHMGACSSTTELDVDYLMENNVEYTRILTEYCLEHDIRFIYASSGATYGNGELGFSDDPALFSALRPTNAYGFSKAFFDIWAHKAGVLDRIAGLRFFNVYGPNEYHKAGQMSLICSAFPKVQQEGEISLFKSCHPDYQDGAQRRDFVYVKDCVAVIEWLLENPEKNGVFNVGTGQARTWSDLATAMFAALDKTPKINYIEMPEHLKEHYQYITKADITRLRNAGYTQEFISLEDGISDYVQNFLVTGTRY